MKRALTIMLSIYFIITFYCAAFNWSLFSDLYTVALGMQSMELPLVMILFLSTPLFLLVLFLSARLESLKESRNLKNLRLELDQLKAANYDKQITEIQQNARSLSSVKQILEKIAAKMEDRDVSTGNTNGPALNSETDLNNYNFLR